MQTQKIIKFKNGLTSDQVHAARAILKQVNVSRICDASKVKVSTIYNVLRDESPRVDQLKIVLTKARAEVRKKEEDLKEIAG
ncbi:hypothetical protein LZZ85_11255 [Terrimonas sp. NA20]|uniref:HTH cro/C1-type domain-containing protein n=1 Tax=Terrimonas ginsenosidimutans TaxID=2908004 RepID=A0ABS9KRF8_9BACT|nr:hypothetical protein [Terrimonas ginsenosidimutans]MCG2614865.1 hypothetical protein [Terrimonas ginsenosidimutans]